MARFGGFGYASVDVATCPAAGFHQAANFNDFSRFGEDHGPSTRASPVTAMRIPKPFDNEWILEPFEGHPTFFTKRMFGGLAAYLHERQMLVVVEPTKSGRWTWHGVLICTAHEHHASIRSAFTALSPHHVLRKWLFLDSTSPEFEITIEAVVRCMLANDPRFGIEPRLKEHARRTSRVTRAGSAR